MTGFCDCRNEIAKFETRLEVDGREASRDIAR